MFTDSDWAGNKTTRKSTSGGCVMFGSHLISHWSKVQSNVALSSGEAELNAAVKGLSELIGFIELYRELDGRNVFTKILTDASACKGMLFRKGVEKVKHLSTKQLWSQGALETYQVEVVKIPRKDNVADMLTHALQGEALHILHRKINFEKS